MNADTQDTRRIVIVGGDAAGLKCAARLRRLLPEARITVLERTKLVSYAGCGLPYYLSGDIDSFDELFSTAWGEEKTPEYFAVSKGVNVFTEHEVVRIDREARRVAARTPEGERSFEYDVLVLATGARPVELEVPGCDLDCVCGFTRPEVVRERRRELETGQVGRVLVAGGGYIGLEVCEAYAALWGGEVVLVEREERVMPGQLDAEMARIVENHLVANDVELHLGAVVERVQQKGDGAEVILSDGATLVVDRVITALGVRPNAGLAREAGLEVGPHGGVRVDAFGCTSDEAIFAAGDCAEIPHGEATRLLPLGSIANRMGRIVANRIAGRDEEGGLPTLFGAGVVKVFDLTVASVGDSAARLRSQDVPVEQYWGSFPDRAHYYPEGGEVRMALVREAEGPVRGLQAVGGDAVVRWVNMVSEILRLSDAGPRELLRVEHAYAPPFATAMDPLHHMGAMALAGPEWQVSPMGLEEGGDPDWTVVALLTEEERASAELPDWRGELHDWSLAALRERWRELEGKQVVTVCARGPRSMEAARFLRHQGIEARYVAGGVAFLKG